MTDQATELLRKVMAYRKGEGRYHYTQLSNFERGNQAFDDWQEIETEIEQYLKDAP